MKAQNMDALQLHLTHAFESHVDFKSRVIRINQEITDATFDLVDTALTEMETHSRKPVTIKISSDGGDVYAGLAIVGRIKKAKCKIITEGYGRVMSSATLVFAAGNKRRISQFCTYMHHEMSIQLTDRLSSNKVASEHFDRIEIICAELLAKNSKKSKKFYLEEAKYTDKYWTPATLREYGLADEVF